MTNLDDIFYYFAIEVDMDHNKNTISLWQSIYFGKILGQYNYKLAKISISFYISNYLIIYEN